VKIKIYSGLSLAPAQIHAVLPDAACLPPIRRGDLSRDIDEGVHVVGIVDGEFFQSLAVAPTEVLDALRTGMAVYGAGSMGALRAAELHEFGMVGCGRIFEQIRAERYFPDDHLGVTFQDTGGANTSLPMVDFAATLDALKIAGTLDEASADSLHRLYDSLHFTERSLDLLTAHAAASTDEGLLHAVDLVSRNIVRQKELDGLALLHRIRDDLAQVAALNTLLNA
jgi:TfuA protein